MTLYSFDPGRDFDLEMVLDLDSSHPSKISSREISIWHGAIRFVWIRVPVQVQVEVEVQDQGLWIAATETNGADFS
jgi:hypothetical protein